MRIVHDKENVNRLPARSSFTHECGVVHLQPDPTVANASRLPDNPILHSPFTTIQPFTIHHSPFTF
jgi:hypothetical protein